MKCSPNHFNLQSWESQDLSSNSVSSCRHSSVPSHHLILAVCCAHSGPIIGTWMTDCQVSALPPANLESSQGGFSNPAFWVPAACSSPQTYSLPPSLSPPCEVGHSNEAVHGNDVRETRNEHQTSRTNRSISWGHLSRCHTAHTSQNVLFTLMRSPDSSFPFLSTFLSKGEYK